MGTPCVPNPSTPPITAIYDNGPPDQGNGMKQLAERHSGSTWNARRHLYYSGGGFASTDAILRYPDFQGGGKRRRQPRQPNYEDDWGEKNGGGCWKLFRTGRPTTTTMGNQLLVKEPQRQVTAHPWNYGHECTSSY